MSVASDRGPSRGLAFTVGHSTHELPELVRILRANGVRQLADVRRHPRSRRVPWFNSEALARRLPATGVAYLHVSELGGRRRPRPDTPNRGWRVASFRGYADHMATPEFAAGLDVVEALAQEDPTAVMCAEGLWWRCHRRLIADALLLRGWEVRHIAPDGSTTAHELTSFARPGADCLTYPPAQTELG